jgi:plastocyanin
MIGALAMWGCGGGGGGASASPTAPTPTATAAPPAATPTTSPAGPASVSVSIVSSIGNTAFVPNPVRANTGDTVTFRNTDSTLHHLVMDDGSADLGDIAPGATSRGFTLRSGNATRFHCTLHPSMVGSINGESAPEPTPCNDPYGYGCN